MHAEFRAFAFSSDGDDEGKELFKAAKRLDDNVKTGARMKKDVMNEYAKSLMAEAKDVERLEMHNGAERYKESLALIKKMLGKHGD
jgi:hypothetical protein